MKVQTILSILFLVGLIAISANADVAGKKD
jgi:hypothetical protein